MVSHSFRRCCCTSRFPQLIAGPIVNITTSSGRSTAPHHSAGDRTRHPPVYLQSQAKAAAVENALGQIADTVFALPAGEIGMLAGWTGAIATAADLLQIFPATANMAIGLGRMFGFHFRENFNYPYRDHHQGVLAPLAVSFIRLVPRLSVYSARRQRKRYADVAQPFSRIFATGLARRKLDVRPLGTVARLVFGAGTAVRFRWTSSRKTNRTTVHAARGLCSALRCSVRTHGAGRRHVCAMFSGIGLHWLGTAAV